MLRFILIILTLIALVKAPFLLWMPIIGVAFVLDFFIPGPPQENTWAQYEQDCLNGVHGPVAKATAERGDFRDRVIAEQRGT